MTQAPRQLLFDGLTADEILKLPEDHIAAIVTVGPIVFRAGSAEILGAFRLEPDRLIVELAQVDGGGEGALPALWNLAERASAGLARWNGSFMRCIARSPISNCGVFWSGVGFR